MKASRQFFTDIGARVADNKCFSFAGDQATRSFLAKLDWDGKGLLIPTASSFRDIGTHLNMTQSHNGKTLTDRMIKAKKMVARPVHGNAHVNN